MSFGSLETDRLLLRAVEPDDLDSLQERRGHPMVNEFMIWDSPYPRERAKGLIAEVLEMDGPADERWWMLTIVEKASGDIVADLAFFMSWQMRTAEIGYTMHPDYWGRGFVSEAVGEAIRWLFEDVGVARILAKIHPDNRASARVVERCGFVFEGHTRDSYWIGEESSDDWIYGLTQPLWTKWLSRELDSISSVELHPINRSNLTSVLDVDCHASQRVFTESAGRLVARALAPSRDGSRDRRQFVRAIVADDTPVGLLAFEGQPEQSDVALWAFLIDRIYQRRGLGSTAFRLAVEELDAAEVDTITVSWDSQRGAPEPFFRRLGFDESGRTDAGRVDATYSIK